MPAARPRPRSPFPRGRALCVTPDWPPRLHLNKNRPPAVRGKPVIGTPEVRPRGRAGGTSPTEESLPKRASALRDARLAAAASSKQKQASRCRGKPVIGTPEGTRTPSLQNRNLTLYPIALRAHTTPQPRRSIIIARIFRFVKGGLTLFLRASGFAAGGQSVGDDLPGVGAGQVREEDMVGRQGR